MNYEANNKNDDNEIKPEAEVLDKDTSVDEKPDKSKEAANKIDAKNKPSDNITQPKEHEVIEKLKELFDVTEYKIN